MSGCKRKISLHTFLPPYYQLQQTMQFSRFSLSTKQNGNFPSISHCGYRNWIQASPICKRRIISLAELHNKFLTLKYLVVWSEGSLWCSEVLNSKWLWQVILISQLHYFCWPCPSLFSSMENIDSITLYFTNLFRKSVNLI
jgi:hypothetical protein